MKFKTPGILLSIAAFVLAAIVSNKIFAPQKSKFNTASGIVGTTPDIDFVLPGIKHNQVKFSDFEGKIIVLNFWATWCPPCLREIPVFVKLQKKWQDRNVIFIGLALDERENVLRFVEKNNINYPIMIGEPGSANIAIKLGNQYNALPYTVIFDKNGKIIKTRAGEVTETMLKNTLTSYL